MNLQNELVGLLMEIDTICREEKLHYCLAEDTAWSAQNKGFLPDNSYEANVFMPAEDIEAFCSIAQKRFPGREIESLYNNPKYPAFYIKYVNCDSLCFDIDQAKHFQTHGLHVNITILRHPVQKRWKRKFFAVLERLWECKEVQQIDERHKFYGVGNFFWRIFGEKAGSKYLYQRLLEHGKRNGVASLFCHTAQGKCRTFDEHFWKNRSIGWLNGIRFSSLGKRYLTEKIPKYNKLNWTVIINEHMPYKVFMADLQENKLFQCKWIKARERYARWYKKHAEATRKQVQQYWNYMFRTETRFSLWDHYKDKRELLKNTYKAGAFEDLKKLLEPYMKEMRNYRKRSLGLCFDPLLLKLVLIVYCNQGNFRLAQKTLDLVPLEHFESIGEYEQRKVSGKALDMKEMAARKNNLAKEIEEYQACENITGREFDQNEIKIANIKIENDLILFECKKGRAFCGNIKSVFEIVRDNYPNRFHSVCVINGDLDSKREAALHREYENQLSFVKKGSTEYKRMLTSARYIFVDDLLLPEYFVKQEKQVVIQVPYWEHIPWDIERVWKKSKRIMETFEQTTYFLIDKIIEDYPVWSKFLLKLASNNAVQILPIERELKDISLKEVRQFLGEKKRSKVINNKAHFLLYECINDKTDRVKKEINKIRSIYEFIPDWEVIFRVSAGNYEVLYNDQSFHGYIVPRELSAELLYNRINLVAASDSIPFVLNAKKWGKEAILLNLREKIKPEIAEDCKAFSIVMVEDTAQFRRYLANKEKQTSDRVAFQGEMLTNVVKQIISER